MTGENKLYLAHVSEPDPNMPNGRLNMIYIVYSGSKTDAEAAIRAERSKECTIEFRDHDLPVSVIVERYGMADGRARPL